MQGFRPLAVVLALLAVPVVFVFGIATALSIVCAFDSLELTKQCLLVRSIAGGAASVAALLLALWSVQSPRHQLCRAMGAIACLEIAVWFAVQLFPRCQ